MLLATLAMSVEIRDGAPSTMHSSSDLEIVFVDNKKIRL